MKTKKILAAIISAILAALMIISFTACTKGGSLYSDANAYVSVYVYGKDGKKKVSVDKLRVAPLEAEAAPETDDNGQLTVNAAKHKYRETPTGLYALELAVRNKDEAAVLPEILVSQFTGKIEYSLITIADLSAGEDTAGDIYKWVFTINGVESDPATAVLKTYDLLEFKYIEETYRTFNVSFKATNGAVILFDAKDFAYAGEKAEMTLSKYLQGQYEEKDAIVNISKELELTLSKDGKTIEKIKDTAADETHEWVVLIDDEEVEGDLTEIMVSNNITVTFDYREIAVETGDATTEAPETAAEE